MTGCKTCNVKMPAKPKKKDASKVKKAKKIKQLRQKIACLKTKIAKLYHS